MDRKRTREALETLAARGVSAGELADLSSHLPGLQRWEGALGAVARSVRPRVRDMAADAEDAARETDDDAGVFFSCLSLPRDALDRICGMETPLQALMETLVYPRTHPNFFHPGQPCPWKRVLLFGPPGCAKTAIVRAVVAHAFHNDPRARFAELSSSDFLSSLFGETEARIRRIFSSACVHDGPVVIYLDEIDSVARVKHAGEDETTRRLKNEFLRGLEAIEEAAHVFCIASTNVPWELDGAIVRRFERRICVPLPSHSARRALLRQCVGPAADSGINWDQAASLTEGYSGADLQAAARHACMIGVRELIQRSGEMSNDERSSIRPRPVTDADLISALSATKPASSAAANERHLQWANEHGEV